MTERDSVVLLKFLKQTGISSIGNDNPMPIIYGFLERITYYNEENDFLVAKLQEKGKRDLTTIVGNLSGINAGESLKLSGRWVHNKKFGEQFQVETFEVTVPATVHGIKNNKPQRGLRIFTKDWEINQITQSESS
jgi:hypothetical protein